MSRVMGFCPGGTLQDKEESDSLKRLRSQGLNSEKLEELESEGGNPGKERAQGWKKIS